MSEISVEKLHEILDVAINFKLEAIEDIVKEHFFVLEDGREVVELACVLNAIDLVKEIHVTSHKPIDVADEFGDTTLSCPNCKQPIIFPLVRNPEHIYDNRPTHCKNCGIEFDWSEQDGRENKTVDK